jgi:hypothetical protein
MMRRQALAVAVLICAYGTSWPPGCTPFGWTGQPTHPANHTMAGGAVACVGTADSSSVLPANMVATA